VRPGRRGEGLAVAAGRLPAETSRATSVTVAALVLLMFMSVLSTTVVSNPLPVILTALHGSSTAYTWVVTSTVLTLTVSTPIWGKLSDVFSTKLLLQLATSMFVASSVLSGLVQNVTQLIIMRFVSGVGLGGIQTLALIALANMVPARERGRYGGRMGAASAAGLVCGPLVGGVVVDTIHWRAVFFVGVPFAVFAMVVIQRRMHIPVARRPVRIDYVGSSLLVGGLTLLLVWLSLAGHEFAWASGASIALALVGGCMLALALYVESRASDPILPLALLRRRATALSIVGGLGAGLALLGTAVFFGQYYQVGRGYSPTTAGLLSIPMLGGVIVASLVSGRLITRTGRLKRYLVSGAALVLVGMAALGTVGYSTPIAFVVMAGAVVGIGVGMTQQNFVLAVQNSVPDSEASAATSAITFFRNLGNIVGLTALGAVLVARVRTGISDGLAEARLPKLPSGTADSLAISAFPDRVESVVRAAYANAMGLVFLCCAGMALISMIAVLGIRELPLRTTLQRKDAPEVVNPPSLATEPF
jgi:MFS family permease